MKRLNYRVRARRRIDPNEAILLARGKTRHLAGGLLCFADEPRNFHAGAHGIIPPAMIGAFEIARDRTAERQRSVAVRAAVEERGGFSVGAAKQHERRSQDGPRKGPRAKLARVT